MDKQEIILILDKWNFWNQKVNTGFQRSGYLAKNEESLTREIGSLERGLSEFKDAKARLIYWEGKPEKHSKIEFVNIIDFLLDSRE